MSLQAVLGVGGFRDAAGEGHVDVVELVPHLVGCAAQQDFNLISELVRGSALALGAQDVVICEFGPRVWQRNSGKKGKKRIGVIEHSGLCF